MDDGGLTALVRGVVVRPVAVTMTFLAALVFGLVSWQRLPVELMPDVSYPTITVRTAYEGAAPQEVEAQVAQPVEEALATLDGLVTIESRSRANNADVVLGFDWGTDMNGAAQSIREALQTTFLPEDADRPLILRYDPSLEPFLRLALSYDPAVLTLPPEQALVLLRTIADQELKRRLEGMKGVAAVRVRGGLEREVRVEVREDWLLARKVTLDQVRSLLAAENVNLAGGSVLEGDTEYLVRTLAEVRSAAELAELRIRRADGVLVPLGDVAILRDTSKERQVVSHLDGAEAVELEVFREADANVVDIAARVEAALFGAEVGFTQADVDAVADDDQREAMQEALDAAEGLDDQLPEGVRLVVLDDQATFVEQAIANLRDAVLQGGVLAVLVLFLFLRDFRATAIVGVAIPVSLVLGFAPLYLGGSTLNLMSLGGLALGVGMLVDNAVVVLEAIQVHRERGVPRVEAAVRGTSEVAAAVTASTLTTVAVFVPIGLVEGIGGQLFGDLSLAVVGSLMASLAVALFLVPMLAALDTEAVLDVESDPTRLDLRGAVAPARAAWADGLAWCRGAAWRWVVLPYLLVRLVLAAAVAAALALARWGLGRTLRAWAWVQGRLVGPAGGLAQRVADRFLAGYGRFEGRYAGFVAGVVARPGRVLGTATALFAASVALAGLLGTELLPEVRQGRFTLEVALPVGTPLPSTVARVTDLEARIGALPGVATVYTTIGSDGRADARADEGEHTARVRVQVEAPDGDLVAAEDAVLAELRGLLDEVTGLEVQVTRPSLFSFRTPLELVVFGRDLDRLQATGDRLQAELEALPGLTDVRSSLQRGNPEVRLVYDREKLARFGLDTATAAQRVRDRIQGVRATEIRDGDQRLDLRVQLVEAQRGSIADLRRLNVNPNVDPPIPLDAVATFEEAVGPSEIRRVDQQRAVVLAANLAGFDLGGAVDEIRALLRDAPLDADLTWTLGGQARELSGALTSLVLALGLAVFLVYVIMASTFESLLHPFVILFTVPLAVIGVVGALGLWGLPVSVVASLGMIVLAGVVVNNAIVLVDAINRLRDEGVDRLDAIREAARTRLRPILVTTLTTVLGLLPLAFGLGAGAEVQQPLAVTVVGGLSVSTLLTLGVVPAVYTLLTARRTAP